METYVSLTITIDDETGHAEVKTSASKWQDHILVYNGPGHKHNTTVAPIGLDQSIYPYILATLRTAMQLVEADLTGMIGRGQVAIMRDVGEQLISLRVAPGPAELSRR